MVDDTPHCPVCRARQPNRPAVCGPCRTRIGQQLADLPYRVARLVGQLPPTLAAQGERVSTSRTGSPTAGRIDVLSLIGPGSAAVNVATAVHPRVRRWSTSHAVTVQYAHLGRVHTITRTIVDWHSEPVAVDTATTPAVDDQVGVVPPKEWATAWARLWQHRLGHSAARRRRLPAGAPVVTVDDPVAAEWTARFGPAEMDPGITSAVGYLGTWLEAICDRDPAGDDPGVVEFAVELAAITGELDRAVGERPDLQWLGRCPALLAHRPTGGGAFPCGAPLWQDPYVGAYAAGVHAGTRVRCPRCRSEWGPKVADLLRLAADIRRMWPIDVRRRYSVDDMADAARPDRVQPTCHNCGGTVTVTWREVTGADDPGRRWCPDQLICDNACHQRQGDDVDA